MVESAWTLCAMLFVFDMVSGEKEVYVGLLARQRLHPARPKRPILIQTLDSKIAYSELFRPLMRPPAIV